jgi:hypothetical protein
MKYASITFSLKTSVSDVDIHFMAYKCISTRPCSLSDKPHRAVKHNKSVYIKNLLGNYLATVTTGGCRQLSAS